MRILHMKVKDLFENTEMYQIISHEVLQSDADVSGASKKGTIYVTGEQLEAMFGPPSPVQGDEKYEWIVEFVYRDGSQIYDPTDEEHEDVDKAIVVIYDSYYNTGDDYRAIDEWSVACKNLVGLWVLEQFIEHDK